MGCPPLLSRLRCLIDKFILQYTDAAVSIAKEEEKNVLIALSQVRREVQLLNNDFLSYSGIDAEETVDETAGISADSSSFSEDLHCLTTIIVDLVILLASDSPYIQHLAGNTLVAIFELLVASGSSWVEFVNSLCLCLGVSIFRIISSFFVHNTIESKEFDCDSSHLVTMLKLRLKHANWSCLAEIIRVLRCMLKYLKQDSDIPHLIAHIHSISSCIERVPWDSLNKVLDQNDDSLGLSSRSISMDVKFAQSPSRNKFLGNLLQFLCTLIDQCDLLDSTACPPDKLPVINKLVPRLFVWCIGERCKNSKSISQYFKHKLMMLLIRLSFQIPPELSAVSSWLNLVHQYFQDVLLQPISRPEADEDDCLEGSPLWSGFHDAERRFISSSHLQRLVIFFFFKCSISLINMSEAIVDHLECACPNSCLTLDLNSGCSCFCRNKGLLGLHDWLQHHLPTNLFVEHELYFERCVSFTLSWLQFFMYEDDILFEMILQLFCIPFFTKQRIFGERTSEALNNSVLIQDLFNPIYLFHLFLDELHYDHQVLLDYLISKDTGTSFAKYLLRCLRAACDSWNVFVEFSMPCKLKNKSSSGKRKVEDDLSFQEKHFSALWKRNGLSPLPDMEKKRKYMCSGSNKTNKPLFKDARDCLLLLKKSVENLHLKKLFPYNPEVLLQRLKRFEALCHEQ